MFLLHYVRSQTHTSVRARVHTRTHIHKHTHTLPPLPPQHTHERVGERERSYLTYNNQNLRKTLYQNREITVFNSTSKFNDNNDWWCHKGKKQLFVSASAPAPVRGRGGDGRKRKGRRNIKGRIKFWEEDDLEGPPVLHKEVTNEEKQNGIVG